MHGEQVDGNDPIAVYKVMKEARERAVNGEGASLIEAMSLRLTPHSSDDDDGYRDKEELANDKKSDCIILFKDYLLKEDIVNQAWLDERSEEHTSELQSRFDLVCRLLLEKKKKRQKHS